MASLSPVVLLFLTSLTANVSFAAVVNFDDLDASSGDIVLDYLSPYQGFTWTNFSVYTTTPGFPGFNNGIVSSPNAAYSGGQNFGASITPVVGTITATAPFDFISGYLGSGYYDNLNVTVEGLLNGAMLFTQTVTVNTEGAQPFNFSFDGINEVDVFATPTASTTDPFSCGTFDCNYVTLDDLTFAPSSGPLPSVPEPSTAALVSLGSLAGLLLPRRGKGWPRILRWLC